MSNPPTDPTGSQLTTRSRVYIACIHCRKRKIRCITDEKGPLNPCERCARRGLNCEYLSVGEQDPYPSSGRDTPNLDPVFMSPAPTAHMPNAWTQSPPQGPYIAQAPAPSPTRYSNSSQYNYNSFNALPSGSQPGPPGHRSDRSSRPQHFPTPAYNDPAMTSAPRPLHPPRYPTPRPATAPHPTPDSQGYYIDYSQMLPDPGHNNTAYRVAYAHQAHAIAEERGESHHPPCP
ncbi:hypothetical protein DFH09DRAFT_1079992 [Mycena vulgaris]|nr:hypothetical protein DFH09DRAFT_1079992 [Mycena vulgaris]